VSQPEITTQSLTVRQHVDAAPERVWRAWTVPAEFVAWMWPSTFQTRFQADLRAGGRYRLESPVAQLAVSGEYQAVEEARRLAFTWRWDGEDEQTLVTLTLAESGEGTELAIEHDGFASEEARVNHIRGWEDCLDRLPAYLA
jgi:uncharacterized protein YndB with AHSA1/START domain